MTTTPSAPPAPPPGRVLVVDDDAGVRRFVLHVLTPCGYAVTALGSAEDALPLVALGGYDVALVDLDLPGRSGLELLAAVPAGGDLVPVLMTGTHDVKAAVAAMQRGAFDYLPKPTDADELRWTVARALGAAHARRRERALERVVGEWEATFDACPDPLIVLAADGHILRANRAAEHLGGGARLRGRHARTAFGGEFGAAVQRCLAGAAEPVGASDAGTGRQFLVSGHPLTAPAGSGPAVIVARDVTSVHQAERAKTKLAHQLLTAQEDERGRIARELHDGVGQVLASIAMGLCALVESPSAAGARERLTTLWRVAAGAVAEIRQMAHRFRPPALDDLGLATALDRLTGDFTRLQGVRAELIVPTLLPRLPPAVELAVYRIVQEALANVARHARARTVDVLLECRGGAVCASVADDGVGFAPAGRDGGIGLAGMRERADMLGGALRVDSTPGRGTTIDLRIPIPEDNP